MLDIVAARASTCEGLEWDGRILLVSAGSTKPVSELEQQAASIRFRALVNWNWAEAGS